MQIETTAVETRGLPSNGAGLLQIPGNQHRVGIIISVPVGGSAFVQVGSSDGQQTGILLTANLPFVALTADCYGSAVSGPISVQNVAAAAMVFGVVEFVKAP